MAVCTNLQPPSCRQPHSTLTLLQLTLRTGCHNSALSWRPPASLTWQPTASHWWTNQPDTNNLRSHRALIYSGLIWSLIWTTTSYFSYKILFHNRDENFKIFTLYFSILGKKKSCKLCFSSDLMFNLNKRTIKTKLNITEQQQCWPQPTLLHTVVSHNLTSPWHNITSPSGWFNI